MNRPLRVLLTGGNGQLGRDLRDVMAGRVPDGGDEGEPACESAGKSILPTVDPGTFDVLSTDIDNLDVTDRTAVLAAADAYRPDLVVHAGAYTAVDACESAPDTAFSVNALGTRHVAEAAARAGAHLVYVSTDYVFDGTASRPYVEWDMPNPQSVYGRSKLGGEHEVAAAGVASATVVRTAWVSGAHGANMTRTLLRLASESREGPLRFVDDQHGTPTFTADLSRALVRLALDRRPGTFHVTNQGETTWFGFAQATLAAAGHDPGMVEPVTTAELGLSYPAPRPANSRLDNAALRLSGLPLLPSWTNALERLVKVLSRH